jgi:hypothetical protein
MDAAKKRLGWMIAGGAVLAIVCGALFAAYQRPGMLASFDEIMAFCAALIR